MTAASTTTLPGNAARPTPWQRLRARVILRWPHIKRQLPRDLLLLAVLFALSRFFAIAWVMTDSVHRSMIVVIKHARPAVGELAVFGYSGRSIPHYYEENWGTRMWQRLGRTQSLDGPRKGDGFVKYVYGIEGDRIEVQGPQVWLVKKDGRWLDMGRCKPASRSGVPLPCTTSQTIPAGMVYMWAPHPDALDSRYALMGLVPSRDIAGTGVTLW